MPQKASVAVPYSPASLFLPPSVSLSGRERERVCVCVCVCVCVGVCVGGGVCLCVCVGRLVLRERYTERERCYECDGVTLDCYLHVITHIVCLGFMALLLQYELERLAFVLIQMALHF